jgi:alcohol dehydrogenase class IV
MGVFYCRTKIISGSGAVTALKDLAPRRLMLVTDPFFAENGTASRIATASGAEKVEIFKEVAPDPDVALAATGTARVKAFCPDVLVALGGGSAMDCAKAMLFFSGVEATLVAIPTTSGSGSEVTDFAILTHDGVKHPLVDPKILPDVAILDDELLQALPKSLIADAGFDVLAHALEAYVALNAGAVTDALARDAFCKAFTCLPVSFAGDTSVRLEMHLASTMAGMAFSQAGLGLCHAMSHVLGGKFHVPHGRLNAILLPAVVEVNAPAAAEKYAEVARAAGLGGAAESVALRNLKNGLVRLRKELRLPGTLAQAGIEPQKVQNEQARIVEAVLADPCCDTNPVPVTKDLVLRVLETVTGHG